MSARALENVDTIRSLYPFALLEGQGMGTAYEYYAKLRVMRQVFDRTRLPRNVVVLGLPEKHGYDLDFVLLAHRVREVEPGASLTVFEDRPEVLAQFRDTLQRLPTSAMCQRVNLVQVDSLTDVRATGSVLLSGRRFDWVFSTAAVQRLPDDRIADYVRTAQRIADYAFLFVPNGGNRAHLTLSGLRGLDLDQVQALCQYVGTEADRDSHTTLLAAGYCDIPPFPPGLRRSEEAKERAMHSPLEALAMWGLQWWCRGESWMPLALQRRLAHLVYIALDLRENVA